MKRIKQAILVFSKIAWPIVKATLGKKSQVVCHVILNDGKATERIGQVGMTPELALAILKKTTDTAVVNSRKKHIIDELNRKLYTGK